MNTHEIDLKPNTVIMVEIPADLVWSMSAIQVLGLEERQPIILQNTDRDIEVSVPNCKDGDSIAIVVSGKNADGIATIIAHFFKYTQLNGWRVIYGSVAKPLSSL